MYKRVLSLFLILCTLLSCISFSGITKDVKADSLPYLYNQTNDSYFESIKNQLPPFTLKIKDGRPFNYKLWRDKGIVVYGDYSYVPSNLQDFKPATIENGVTVQ
ncbi:MAG: hypothetical protein QXW71_02885, partial [Thermoplasmata archaeon]